MKRHFWKALLVVAGLAVAGLLLHSRRSYEGRSLTQWFDQYAFAGTVANRWDTNVREEAIFAFQQMGTNAVSYLLDEAFVTRDDSILRVAFHSLKRFFGRNSGRLPTPIEIQGEAANALRALQPPATLLLPRLTNALTSTHSITRNQALYLLGCVGVGSEECVPYLILGLKEKDPIARTLAAQSLGWLGPKARAAIPAMMESLETEPNNGPLFRLIKNLGSFGPEAKEAVPLLAPRLDSPQPMERLYAAAALYQIGIGQTQAWAVLTDTLSVSNTLRRDAFLFMGQIRPARMEFIPLLMEGARDSDIQTTHAAIQALQGISSEAAVAALVEKFEDSQVQTRLWAAAWLLRLQPDHPGALSLVTAYLESGEVAHRLSVLRQLGDAHAHSTNVITLLQGVPKEHRMFRRAADRSVERILRRKSRQK